MFEKPVIRQHRHGVIYREQRYVSDSQPLLFIHGIGGYHAKYQTLHQSLLKHNHLFTPFYVDLPGYGMSSLRRTSLELIRSFLQESYQIIADIFNQPVVLGHISASIWFSIGHAQTDFVDDALIIAINPVSVPRERSPGLDSLIDSERINIRHLFLSKYFGQQKLQKMDSDLLGRPNISVGFLKELWAQQGLCPFAGWSIPLIVESTKDPLRDLRVLPRGNYTACRIEGVSHGVSDLPFAKEVVNAMVNCLEQGQN